MLGSGSYLAVARAWLAAGDAGRAREVLEPVAAAARTQGWQPVLAQVSEQLAVIEQAAGDRAGA